MRAADLVIETLAHFVGDVEGPAPGVPSHVDPGFETRFASICIQRGLTPIVARSLDTLVLPPAVSRVTAQRLARHGEDLRARTARRLRLARRLVEHLEEAGVPALVAGEARAAASYAPPEARTVGDVELLVHEAHAVPALGTLEAAGFSVPRAHPVFGPAGPTQFPGIPEELVAYHHYIAPLIVANGDGDRVRVRFRVVDVGHPEARELAWERAGSVEIAGGAVGAVGVEDHLLGRLVRLGASDFGDLGALGDVGRILHGGAGPVDWGYFAARARMNGLYGFAYCALERAGRAMRARWAVDRIPQPASLYLAWLRTLWDPSGVDYARERDARFRFGLVACGGPVSKARWALRWWVPRRRWVENACGPATNPWSWIKFLLLARIEPHRGARRARARLDDTVTPLGRNEP